MDGTGSLDGEAKKDGATLNVALFAPKEWAIYVTSSSIGWAITTKKSERDKGADSFKVVLLPEHMKSLQDRKSPILSSPYLETGSNTMEEFKKGRQLMTLSSPIWACVGKKRPQLLYRAVHEGHPGNGLHARGFGTIKTDQISFALHFDHHLDWKRRDASPFMSATTDRAKADRIARWYESEGFSNIEVLVIKVNESEWRSEPTIWHVRETAGWLGLSHVQRKRYYDSEYLIEDYIPASCVARERWEGMKADNTAETTKMKQSRKRKWSAFDPDSVAEGMRECGERWMKEKRLGVQKKY